MDFDIVNGAAVDSDSEQGVDEGCNGDPRPALSSPLVSLSPELLTLIALHLASAPPNLGPPAPLLPLLRTCRALHARLGSAGNGVLWARIARAKFAAASLAVDSQRALTKASSPIPAAVHALRAHCRTLQTLRAGDPHAPDAGRALVAAYTLLVQDSWDAAPLGASTEGLPALPEALRPLHATGGVERQGKVKQMDGKNRKQLAWAGAREFAMRFVRERLYEGRYGEDDDDSDAESAWCVGWPRDTAAGAAALWVLWFFEGWIPSAPSPSPRAARSWHCCCRSSSRRFGTPPPSARRTITPSRSCPPSRPLHLGRGGRQPRSRRCTARIHSIRCGGSDTSATRQARTGIFRASTAPWTRSTGKTPTRLRAARPGDRDGTATPPRHPPPALLRFASPAPAPTLFRDGARARRLLDGGIPTRARHGDDPALQRPPPPAAGNRAPQPRTHSRTLLTAPPARLLFFARMQAGGRMGVPPHLARDRAEAEARWS
ncbi:hypothetical protein B0H17DRAFT_1108070, partial [Mycena rosella]